MLYGIGNRNEFYSNYYFEEIFPQEFAEDVKASDARESEDRLRKSEAERKGVAFTPYRGPWKVLGSYAAEYKKAVSRLESEKGYRARLQGTDGDGGERGITRRLLSILGFEPKAKPEAFSLTNGLRLPLLHEEKVANGSPYLWVFEASTVAGTKNYRNQLADLDTDPAELCVSPVQMNLGVQTLEGDAKKFADSTWFEIISDAVFAENRPPRWVLLCGAKTWLLFERRKFARRQFLSFSWEDILGRRDQKTLEAAYFLLGKKNLMPEDGACRLDRFDESSNRHAYGVSQDLKYALREAIELLGNEAAKQILASQAKGHQAKEIDPVELSKECLRYMYRLLFIFFIESRPDLKYVPSGDEAYQTGYSLESLRDLELVPLLTEEEREGRFFHDTISKLFRFFSHGTDSFREEELEDQQASKELFRIIPLPSRLFDDSGMKMLEGVVFPNRVLQRVIELMSLSREGSAKGRKRARRGRISYAHLGLNQLGAVYESLLSYTGFFAKENLYEVKKAGEKGNDPLLPAYFVPEAELSKYTDAEKVFDRDPTTGEQKLRVYPKGTFIYRMAGRARENSASYYTPESLTKCIVSEALEVLVEQQLKGMTDAEAAKRILSWKICEPAMGSAAFLNEAVNQVAELYMKHAMKVPGAPRLTESQYEHELQKVKMRLADRNIYGVDLNPVAVELGEVSLWLNSLSDDHYVPFFGMQLVCGNSLVGCRREVFDRKDLERSLKNARPHPVSPDGLKEGEIYHFLVPDAGMCSYTDKVVKKVAPEEIARIDAWRKTFTGKLSSSELDQMEILSSTIDLIWKIWVEKEEKVSAGTTDSYSIYGEPEKKKPALSFAEKQSRIQEVKEGTDEAFNSGEYSRLKLAMDYWCSLWFWPITRGDLLPTRRDFLSGMRAILSGIVTSKVQSQELPLDDPYEEQDEKLNTTNLERRLRLLKKAYPAIKVVTEVAERERFLHWPLQFATVFYPMDSEERTGFDMTLGNPPWIVASWDASAILSEANPEYSIHAKNFSAKAIQDVILGKDGEGKDSIFAENSGLKNDWLDSYAESAGYASFYNSRTTYPELEGSAADLFKLFLPVVWRNSSSDGVQGLLHPDTIYTETKGITLRSHVYSRVRRHYQFSNEKRLFPDVHHHVSFSVNVYGKPQKEPGFVSISDLFTPQTIAACRVSTEGELEGRKNSQGEWNTKGHKSRLISIDRTALDSFAKIFGSDPRAPMLPSIYAKPLLDIIEKFGKASGRLGDLGKSAYISGMWHETAAKKDGTINELSGNETVFPEKPENVILNGPHLYVGSPLFKCPDNPCNNNLQWSNIDLTVIPDDYLPRVKYLPTPSREEYVQRMNKTPWDGLPEDRHYRLALREFVGTESERTLTSSLVPIAFSHIFKIITINFKKDSDLLDFSGVFSALPLDFFIRFQNKADLQPAVLRMIPAIKFNDYLDEILCLRVLSLNCLTRWYADLWNRNWKTSFTNQSWATIDNRINQKFFASLTPQWTRTNALRTDLERRQALLEIDVIVAQGLGLTLEELQTCYRLGFRVLRDNEENTWYDQSGRIVFTSSAGLRGVGLPGKAKFPSDCKYAVDGEEVPQGIGFEDVKDKKSGTVSKTFYDTTLADKPVRRTITYQAPFFRKSREEDYAEAWRYFEALGK